MSVTFIDNSDEVLAAFDDSVLEALEKCGLMAEGYAKQLAAVDTGRMRNDISHKVVPGEPAAYVGTNVEYGPYVEMGTGIYAEGGGRQDPWVYQDANGNWHWTRGQTAKPFIKPSVADHVGQYKKIIEDTLKNG